MIEARLLQRIDALIQAGENLCLRAKTTIEADCQAFFTATEHVVSVACQGSGAPYQERLRLVLPEVREIPLIGIASDLTIACTNELTSMLKWLKADLENGLIASVVSVAQAETLDDLLDQADAYLSRNHKEGAGVLGTVIFEDTLRRIARKQQIDEPGTKTDELTSKLQQQGAITQVLAKRCRAAAGVRNHALHAQWDQFSLHDVDVVIQLTRQLLSSHLPG